MSPEGGSCWEHPLGVLLDVLRLDYAGNGVNNRVIALGGVYDEVEIVTREDEMGIGNWLFRAWASGIYYGLIYMANNLVTGRSGSLANTLWQGLNEARDEVTLGSTGATAGGTNMTGKDYRLTARRYRSIS